MTENELKIHAKKKELLRMLSDIHREIVFNDLEDEGFRNMLRESLRVIIDRSDKKIKKLEIKLKVEKHFNKDMTDLILKHIEDMKNIL